MYVENGNSSADLSSRAIAILSDEGTREVQYLENQEQENLFQGQSYCNINETNPSATLVNDDASKYYQEVCDCILIQSKISKLEQCIAYFEKMVKEQAEAIHLLSLDMSHFSKKGKIIDLTDFLNPVFLSNRISLSEPFCKLIKLSFPMFPRKTDQNSGWHFTVA